MKRQCETICNAQINSCSFFFFQNGRVNNVRLNQCKKISIQLPASSMASFIFVTIFRQSYFNSFMQGTLVRRNGGHVGGGRCLQRRPPTSNLICDVDGCSLVFPTFQSFWCREQTVLDFKSASPGRKVLLLQASRSFLYLH